MVEGPPKYDLDSYGEFVEFFDQAVMAAYLQQADRFLVETDHFEGRLSSRYAPGGESQGHIDIRFGYRTLQSGDLAIVVFRPDLYKKSPAHAQRWAGFKLAAPQWESHDERYSLWLRRYLDGDWGVENGPRAQLQAVVQTINALTRETVGSALFSDESIDTVTFPLAENTHRYQDSHQTLYGLLIDGLAKECIRAIGQKAGAPLKLASDKTIAALKKLPSVPPDTSPLWGALELTSQQRRIASHKRRPDAVRFRAFEQFSADLQLWHEGLRDLLSCLEPVLGIRGDMAEKRQSAKAWLPEITEAPKGNYSICQLPQIEGKTVARVEYGFRKARPRAHRSEAMILHFTDGSSLGIDTGSNVENLTDDHDSLEPADFHVDFNLQWVPSAHG